MATGQSERPPAGPRRGKKREPTRGEGAGLPLEGKKEIRDKGKGGGGEEMHLQGAEPQVSLSINKGIVAARRRTYKGG
jgi:hypothetical protein